MPMRLIRPPEKPDNSGSPFQDKTRALNLILEETFGVPFLFYDAATGQCVSPEAAKSPGLVLAPGEITALAAAGQAHVAADGPAHFLVTLVLYASGAPILVAAGALPALSPPGAN